MLGAVHMPRSDAAQSYGLSLEKCPKPLWNRLRPVTSAAHLPQLRLRQAAAAAAPPQHKLSGQRRYLR